MRITDVHLLRTVHHWGRPVGDINGSVASGTTVVPLVLLRTDTGHTGVGLGACDGVEEMFDVLEGADPAAVTALYDRMLARVFKAGHGGSVFGAIGALDMALWDLKAKAVDQPLWKLLGGADRVVPGYASALDGPLTDGELFEAYSQLAAAGFPAAKLKGGLDIATDLRRLSIAQEAFAQHSGHKPRLMLDANEGWSRKEAVAHVRALEERVDLAWVEEPVRRHDAEGHAVVTAGIRAAVATGENLTGLEHYRPFLAARGVDVVQAGSIWGITHFLRVAALAHGHELPVSPVAYHANPLAHAATALPNHLAAEVQDLTHPVGLRVDQEFADGAVILGDSPGLGIEVDEQLITDLQSSAGWGAEAGPHTRPLAAGRRMVTKEAFPPERREGRHDGRREELHESSRAEVKAGQA